MAVKLTPKELDEMTPRAFKRALIICISLMTSWWLWIALSFVVYHFVFHVD